MNRTMNENDSEPRGPVHTLRTQAQLRYMYDVNYVVFFAWTASSQQPCHPLWPRAPTMKYDLDQSSTPVVLLAVFRSPCTVGSLGLAGVDGHHNLFDAGGVRGGVVGEPRGLSDDGRDARAHARHELHHGEVELVLAKRIGLCHTRGGGSMGQRQGAWVRGRTREHRASDEYRGGEWVRAYQLAF